MGHPFRQPALAAARAADDKKAEDILLLDIHGVSGLADYVLLVNANSPAQLEAVEYAIDEALEGLGLSVLHRDGKQSDLWRVLDYGGLLIHLMAPEARSFYGLDKLFRDAKHERWQLRSKPGTSRAR